MEKDFDMKLFLFMYRHFLVFEVYYTQHLLILLLKPYMQKKK